MKSDSEFAAHLAAQDEEEEKADLDNLMLGFGVNHNNENVENV